MLVTYSGELWELDPVEVRARPRPPRACAGARGAGAAGLRRGGRRPRRVLRRICAENDLALVVSRNVTTRDDADRQQPFNLRVAGRRRRPIGAPGKIYDVAHLQFFQGDQMRGMGGARQPRPGRRVLAQPMHDPAVKNPP